MLLIVLHNKKLHFNFINVPYSASKARLTYSFSNFINESRKKELREKGNAQFALNNI